MVKDFFYILAEVFLWIAIAGCVLKTSDKKHRMGQYICLLAFVIIEFIVTEKVHLEEVYTIVCLTCIFIYFYLMDSYNSVLEIFVLDIITYALFIICNTILAIPISILYASQIKLSIMQVYVTISAVEVIVAIILVRYKNKILLNKYLEIKGIKILLFIIGIWIIILKQIGLHSVDTNQKSISIIIGNLLVCAMIFGILWLIDHYRLSKGKLKAEQDSSRMNADLHRSKELMPLLLSVVNENQGLLDPQIVEEFQRIYAEQMIVGKRENMNYKLMGTTGITLLDSHLQHYIMECARKNIVMDVFVSEPIEDDMRELKIAQLQVHNVMGDMIRNAIRAIERVNKTDGKILVIIGKKEADMEIVVYDNGQMIPELVLEKFGERGVTTGGTGNGLADLVDLLNMYDGSLVIEEKDASSSAYTKGIHLVFDGKCRRELYTVRVLPKKICENGFWTKIENVENG